MKQPAVLRRLSAVPRSDLHDRRLAALVGSALGVAFALCFATGLLSHFIQEPPGWFDWTSRPAGLYRISQGLHVVTGFVSIPLLLAKLWIVVPKLIEWPPARSVAQAFERLSLLPLVGGGLFLVVSGTFNVARTYPWQFFFPAAHYWVAWLTIGALIVHLGAKWAVIRSSLGSPDGGRADVLEPRRRQFLAGVGATAATVFVGVAGSTVGPLSRLSVLAQRRPGVGPQGLPVNKSAVGARVVDAATSTDYRLVVEGKVAHRLELTLSELAKLPQRTAELPLACVEGWSTSAVWTGVPLRDLLDMAGAAPDAEVRVESLQPRGSYRVADVSATHANDRDTLLALRLNGEELHLDHGYPVRLIGPNRPGVLQTKWVARLVVT